MSTPPAETEILLEWTYSPRDFVESAIEIARSDYNVDIDAGVISAQMPASVFDSDPSYRDRLHEDLLSRMRGIQILSRMPFHLSKPRLTRIEPDGRRHIFVELQGARLTISGGLVDITVTDANGKLIRDTKQERSEKKRELADLVAKFADDGVLKSMLKSYAESVSDANNELVHLYEIRDSLSTAFGNESKARSLLTVSRHDWSRLGQLSNVAPLRQGRHRGQKFETLRDATEVELMEARDIARRMIEAYLQFRDEGGATP